MPRRIKKSIKPLAPENIPVPPLAPKDPGPNPPKSLFDRIRPWLGSLVLLLAIGSILKGQDQLGEILLVVAAIFQIPNIKRPNLPAWVNRVTVFLGPITGVILVLSLWGAFSLVLLTFLNFKWAIPPKFPSIPYAQSYGALLVLFIGMVLGFWLLPEKEAEKDLSPLAARFWLITALGVGAYLSLCHVNTPVSTYWMDNDLENPRYVADLHIYPGGVVFGAEEPFGNWLQILFYRLFPGLSSIVIERISATLVDLCLIWLLYLLGKEVGGRRTGVIAAALGSVSKPVILKVIWAVRMTSPPLGPALALLFIFRLLKKPDLSHFLQWGLALAIGTYFYAPYRPFIPFFIFFILGWAFLHEKKQDIHWSWWAFVGASALVFFIYFAYTNDAFTVDGLIARILAVSGDILPCLVLICFFLLALFVFPKMWGSGTCPKLTGWLAGSWLCVLASFPIMGNDVFIGRIREYESISSVSVYFSRLVQNAIWRFQAIFFEGGDRSDMAIPGDAFFGYSEVIVIGLGLAFYAARPTKLVKNIVFLSALMGLAPYIVSGGTHSGRAMVCITPFFILGAMGLNQLLSSIARLPKGRFFFFLAVPCLVAFWIWSGQSTFSRVYHQFNEKYYFDGSWVRLDAIKCLEKGDLVYLDSHLEHDVGSTLYEGHPVHLFWLTDNVIFLGADEKPPNEVVVYLYPPEVDMKKKMMASFPTAQWESIQVPMGPDSIAFRCSIPFADVAAYSDKYLKAQKRIPPSPHRPTLQPPLFEVRQVSPPYWERRYSPFGHGLTGGFLDYEDKVFNANDPPRSDMDFGQKAIQYKGVIHVSKAGKYRMTWSIDNQTRLRVDGRQILDILFPKTKHFPLVESTDKGEKTIDLKEGDHQVDVLTVILRTHGPPDISLRRADSVDEPKSLWTSFNF